MKHIDLDELATFLTESEKMLSEAEILNRFFPDVKVYNITKTELYHIHFSLYHHLYKLKPILESQNLNMKIHFMRIGIESDIPLFVNDTDPPPFTPSPLGEGGGEVKGKGGFISQLPAPSSKLPDTIDSLALFYLDETNYDFFSEEILENWHNSMFHVMRNNDYYHEALNLLMIKEDFTMTTLKNNYRILAKQYHPDLNPTQTADYQMFLDVNRAYQFLLKCLL